MPKEWCDRCGKYVESRVIHYLDDEKVCLKHFADAVVVSMALNAVPLLTAEEIRERVDLVNGKIVDINAEVETLCQLISKRENDTRRIGESGHTLSDLSEVAAVANGAAPNMANRTR